MYWIYLIIFVLAVLTPKIIHGGALFLPEEDIEALLIFCFGVVGFMVYFVKERALIRALQEKLHLQKKTNTITRDLSDSYSYIGEMNRKFDIVKDLIFRLPKDTADALSNSDRREAGIYRSVLEAAHLLSKADAVSVRFINVKTKKVEKIMEGGDCKAFPLFEGEKVLQSKKMFHEEDGYIMISSPRQACGVMALIVFPKMTNHLEDVEIFKILASEALLLYCIEQNMLARSYPKQ